MLFFSNKSILKRVVSEADPHPAGTAAPVARAISPPIPADPHPAGTARAYRRYCPKKRTEWRPAGVGAPEPPAEPPALRCPACGGEVYQAEELAQNAGLCGLCMTRLRRRDGDCAAEAPRTKEDASYDPSH